MTVDYNEQFQDRIDELLLIEQRIDRRSSHFIDVIRHHQNTSQATFDGLMKKASGLDEGLAQIKETADQVGHYVAYSQRHALRTARLFLWTLGICLVLLLGVLWFCYNTYHGLAWERAKLAALNIKLKHTPVIVHFKGKEYVRVVPHSETQFTRDNGTQVPGWYAKMWHYS